MGLKTHLTFSTETHDNAIFPQSQERKGREPKGELIRLSDVISQDYSNDKTDLSSLIKNEFCRLTTTRISKIKSICFRQKPTFVSAKPSVPCATASWPVLDFWCSSLQRNPNKHQKVEKILKQKN